MISEKFSLREMVENISNCGFYDMIHKINTEVTEAERFIIRHKRNMDAESPEEKYAEELKSLISFLRYDIFLGKVESIHEHLFSDLKRNLETGPNKNLSEKM